MVDAIWVKDFVKMTIKEIESKLMSGEFNADFFHECQADPRKTVQTLLKRYLREQAERERIAKLYQYENTAYARGHQLVAGIDEAGRGPLAGPVAVAAVILPPNLYLPKLNDSKKLSAKVRENLFEEIVRQAVTYKIVMVDVKTIDRINILQATINGMYEAIFGLSVTPEEVLIDAVELSQITIPCTSLVRGDSLSASIAAASILAKVTRDHLFDEYDKKYPEYGFARHKGYGTAEHIAAIREYGVLDIHRRSFEPIKSM